MSPNEQGLQTLLPLSLSAAGNLSLLSHASSRVACWLSRCGRGLRHFFGPLLVAVHRLLGGPVPRFSVPDFHVVGDSNDHDLLGDSGIFHQSRRYQDSPLRVARNFLSTGKEQPLEPSRGSVIESHRVDLLNNSSPFPLRVRRNARLYPAVEKEASSLSQKKGPKVGGYAHPPLFINRVPVFAIEGCAELKLWHKRSPSPLFGFLLRFLPLFTTLVNTKMHQIRSL